MWINKPSAATAVLLLSAAVAANPGGRTGLSLADQPSGAVQPIAVQQETRPRSAGLVGENPEEYEKRLTLQLERSLAKLRTATTAEEKQRLERAIVELVRVELRCIWLPVAFTLHDVDAEKYTIRATIARTSLMVDGILVAKDATVWIDGQPSRLRDLSAGMAVALQVPADAEQRRVVGVRASRGSLPAVSATDVDRLARQLGSDRFDEREMASKALAALGIAARQALTRATMSGDAEVRTRAKRLLEAMASKEETWYFSANHEAAPDSTRRCSIVEVDGKTYCINERGERSRATVLFDRNRIEVAALDWGLKGRIEMGKEGTQIRWANGSKWTHMWP
jgi:hypothetical protein